jgi:environmental stress-induced protein Ves
MIPLTILRATHYVRMPWKNGGGSTEEITRDTATEAPLEGFGWRVSIADISESGAFSSFAGYQRIITVLQGEGMRLRVDGKDSRPLMPFDAFAFKGDSVVESELLGGQIRDFNLIYSPQRFHARLQWFDGALPVNLFTTAATLLVFSACDDLQVRISGHEAQTLGIYDCVQVEAQGELLKVSLTGRCCMIELQAIAAAGHP